jgi:UDP-galactopyranose mutase
MSRTTTRTRSEARRYAPPPVSRAGEARIAPAASRAAETDVFSSFWMAGYEGADHFGDPESPLCMGDVTQHHSQLASDYMLLSEFDIRTVRESVGWRVVDQPGGYDFSSIEARACCAQARGLQVVWTLCHYGWPSDVDVFSAAFVDRFARYAAAVARYLSGISSATPVYVPINEISFLSWAACESGLIRVDTKGLRHRSRELKRQLVRATIAACEAIWHVDPRARFLHTDPLVHVVAPEGRRDAEQAAHLQNERQFEAWDMLSGRVEPWLGGHPRYLDMLGINYYCTSQWELLTGRTLGWRLDDPRRVRLNSLLAKVHRRYYRPLVIAETGHVGVARGAWLREVADEVRIAGEHSIPIEAVCLYPIIDRPDWDNTEQWQRSGLWDLEPTASGALARKLNASYAAALHEVQRTQYRPLAALAATAPALPPQALVS